MRFWQRHPELSFFRAVSYRLPRPVVEMKVFHDGNAYCICPRCKRLLDREYITFCDRCGQHLAWELLDHAKIIEVSPK